MLTIPDTIAGDDICFYYVEGWHDLRRVVRHFVERSKALAIDTESTGINCYRVGWKLRTIQIGNAYESYVIPAEYESFIAWLMRQDVKWIGHNGPHDIRSIDAYLGYETTVTCAGETYIPSHHRDSRNQKEGGVGHGLKELAISFIDPEAGKWEKRLKAEFKRIQIPMDGVVYKSGPRKGQPRSRKAKLSEGWSLIDPRNPTYIAYAAADPILTYRVWRYLQNIVKQQNDLYQFDRAVAVAADRLQRRAIRLDIDYTERLSAAFQSRAEKYIGKAAGVYGCANIHSGQQVAKTLVEYGAKLTERTPGGQLKTDDRVLRALLASPPNPEVRDFIRCVLIAKQLLKRRTAYTEAMLQEMDAEGRVHPSINTLGARTTRMSVSNPPLQQLPTKDHSED